MRKTGKEIDIEYRLNFEGFRKAIRNPHIKPSAKAVFTDLLLYAGNNGACFPTKATLAQNQGISERQITNLIKELQEHKLISWEKRENRVSNKYKFNKEVYFPIKEINKKYTSRDHSNQLPLKEGNTLPPNIVSNNSQKSESKKIANNIIFANSDTTKAIDPNCFLPSSAEEVAALEAWKKLEPNNTSVFSTTYINAIKLGLPASKFYEFTSQINQDKQIINKGAIFNIKVKEWMVKKLLVNKSINN